MQPHPILHGTLADRGIPTARTYPLDGRFLAGFMVINDAIPISEGGFRPGTIISVFDMKHMLAIRTISQGTELVYRERAGGKLSVWIVDYAHLPDMPGESELE